jgi:hypothetical protein
MKYITEAQLLQDEVVNFSASRQFLKESASQARLPIFLSHSHRDRAYVKGLIARFAAQGIAIYVDWNDSTMPRITSKLTAAQIKRRMSQCHLFVVLATKNAVESKWVPWETGVADQMKGEERVLVVPVADPSGRFQGAEYLGLYRKIAINDLGCLSVFEAETNRDLGTTATYFSRFAA